MSKQYTNLTGQAVAFDFTSGAKTSARRQTSLLSRRTRRTERRSIRSL